jgi:hypothetical protein
VVGKIGKENICANIEASLKQAREILDFNADEERMEA